MTFASFLHWSCANISRCANFCIVGKIVERVHNVQLMGKVFSSRGTSLTQLHLNMSSRRPGYVTCKVAPFLVSPSCRHDIKATFLHATFPLSKKAKQFLSITSIHSGRSKHHKRFEKQHIALEGAEPKTTKENTSERIECALNSYLPIFMIQDKRS